MVSTETRFDNLARALASQPSRRSLLKSGLAATIATISHRLFPVRPVKAFGVDYHERITLTALQGLVDERAMELILGCLVACTENVGTGVRGADDHQFSPEQHFDSAPNLASIEGHWKAGLDAYLNSAVSLIFSDAFEQNWLGSRAKALGLFGQAAHALQDFYSHTNWVELKVVGQAGVPPLAPLTGASFDPGDPLWPNGLQSGYFDLKDSVLGTVSGCPYNGEAQSVIDPRTGASRLRGVNICVALSPRPDGCVPAVSQSVCPCGTTDADGNCAVSTRQGTLADDQRCDVDEDCCSGVCSDMAPPDHYAGDYCHEHLNKDKPNPDQGGGSGDRCWSGTSYHDLAVSCAVRATFDLWKEFQRRVEERFAETCMDGACVFQAYAFNADPSRLNPFNIDGQCTLINGEPCAEGTGCCDAMCVDLDHDVNHCGACGTTCADRETCNFGNCECDEACQNEQNQVVCPQCLANGEACDPNRQYEKPCCAPRPRYTAPCYPNRCENGICCGTLGSVCSSGEECCEGDFCCNGMCLGVFDCYDDSDCCGLSGSMCLKTTYTSVCCVSKKDYPDCIWGEIAKFPYQCCEDWEILIDDD